MLYLDKTGDAEDNVPNLASQLSFLYVKYMISQILCEIVHIYVSKNFATDILRYNDVITTSCVRWGLVLPRRSDTLLPLASKKNKENKTKQKTEINSF